MLDRSAQGVATEYAAAMGEQLVWSGRPLPGRHAIRWIPGLLFGLPFILMVPLLLSASWASAPALTNLLRAVGLFLFAVGGGGLVLGPLTVYRRAQRTVYALTSAGAYVILEGATRHTEAYRGPDLAHVRCVERPDGSGDLVFPSRLVGRSPGCSGGFYGVPGVLHVLRQLRSGVTTLTAASPAPPPERAVLRLVIWVPVLGSVGMLGFIAFFIFLMLHGPPSPPGSASAQPSPSVTVPAPGKR